MGRRKNFDYDEILSARKKNIVGIINKEPNKKGYNGYDDVVMTLFTNGLYSQILADNNILINRILSLVFGSSASDFFTALDSLLQNTPSGVVPLSQPNLNAYYGVPVNVPILALSGTEFTAAQIQAAFSAGTYFMIPSSYPIVIAGFLYQSIGSGPTAVIRVTNDNNVTNYPINQPILLRNVGITVRLVTAGSPGLMQTNTCPNYETLDGGTDTDTSNLTINGGLITQSPDCFIDGGVVFF